MTRPKPSSQKQPDLTIVIPALHEEKRIGRTLDALADFLKHDNFFKRKDVEVLVVGADTSDRTHAIVLEKRPLFRQLKLLKPGRPVGKGYDVQYGMLRASGKIIVFMDADLATPLHHLEKFYTSCKEGSDVAVGTRNLFVYRPSMARRFASFAGNILFRIAGGIWIEDSQCGFKMFTSRAAKLCFSRLTIMGWGFDMELLAIAKANRLKIYSYRVDDWRDVPNGTFTDGILRIAARSLVDMGHIVSNRVRGAYFDNDA